MSKKRTKGNQPEANQVKSSNAQRGTLPRVKPSLRIDTATNDQLKEWGSRPCSRGVGDVVDRVVKFAKKKKFNPCGEFKVDVTSI